MSGTLRAPGVAGVSPSTSRPAQLADLSEQLLRKADVGGEPVFAAIILRAPNGAHFRVTVSNAGTLAVAPF